MSRVLVLKLQSHDALAAVVRSGGARIVVEAGERVPLAEGDDAKSAGEALAAALAPLKLGRAPTVVVVPRTELAWQTYELPPSPVEDLPDLVHMQAQRDIALADDGEGFDFLPLAGDEEHPYRVLGVGVLPAQLARVREICSEADLKLERVVPEPLGWPELGRRIVAAEPGAMGLFVFAAVAGRQAIVWAEEDGALRLVRTVWLPAEPSAAGDAQALAGEYRRTLLALSQPAATNGAPPRCVYCGENAAELAGELASRLSRPVDAASLAEYVEAPAGSAASLVDLAPMAAHGSAVAERRAPHLDLLHPRRRPMPPSRKRTYVLAAAAAGLAVLLAAWQGYRRLNEPLEAAAAARAEQTELEPLIERLSEDQKNAAAIRTWIDEAPNLLDELDHLGQQLRPEALDSEKFKPDEDLVVTKLSLNEGIWTVDAVAKSNAALQPAEQRLRKGDYLVDRGVVDPKAEGVPGYTVKVTATVERTAPTEGEGEPSTEAAP
jgi:hypothetical protein